MNPQGIRVRMAPSPTGYLHVGGLRTAFFNWLFAHHNHGAFLIRIEDTDLERSKPEYTQSILQSFAWADIASDEPIVIQSERLERHKAVAQQMLDAGKAYRCFCTPAELEARLGANAKDDGYTKYDRLCREYQPTADDLKKPFAIRFKLPLEQHTLTFDDVIHGEISFDLDTLDDFVIVRSDGSPMYNFVVVVDDADMQITHVIRGDDHISNTPKQLLLYSANNFVIPRFAHLPMILGPDGQRLSKRHAATAVIDYKKNGFLAAALCNYLVRLGWSHGDQEVFTRKEMIDYFTLEAVGKKAAIFDSKKLEWMNSIYIKNSSAEELLQFIQADVDPEFCKRVERWSLTELQGFINLYKERVKTLKELVVEIESAYHEPQLVEADLAQFAQDATRLLMRDVHELLSMHHDYTPEALAVVLKELSARKQVSFAAIGKPLRLALTGKLSSPGVFELLSLLGKSESMKRLHYFLESIEA